MTPQATQQQAERVFETLYPPDSPDLWFHFEYRSIAKRAFVKGYVQCLKDMRK
jgi:hypothetical protein